MWSPCQRRPIVGWVAHRCGCWLYAFGLVVVRVSTVRKDMEGSDEGLASLSARCWVLREHASVSLSQEMIRVCPVSEPVRLKNLRQAVTVVGGCPFVL